MDSSKNGLTYSPKKNTVIILKLEEFRVSCAFRLTVEKNTKNILLTEKKIFVKMLCLI
jgi:hypothetical protein